MPEFPFHSQCEWFIGQLGLLLGLVGVFTSVMIYHDTRRALWRFSSGGIRFFGTVATFAALGRLIGSEEKSDLLLLGAVVILKLVPELRMIRFAGDEDVPWSPANHSARLQMGPLGVVLRARVALSGIGLAIACIHPRAALPVLLLAEILERRLFFQSVLAPKMPGNFGPPPGH